MRRIRLIRLWLAKKLIGNMSVMHNVTIRMDENTLEIVPRHTTHSSFVNNTSVHPGGSRDS